MADEKGMETFMGIFEDNATDQIGLDELDWLEEQLKKNLPNFGTENVEVSTTTEIHQVLSSYVRMTDDRMAAYLYLKSRETGEYSEEEILEILAQNNICYGVDKDMIRAIIQKRVYEEEVQIAFGCEPRQGASGYFEYFFKTTCAKMPEVRKDGSVDYASMSKLENVRKDQLIVKYHPAEKGTEGKRVDGSVVLVSPGAELPPLKGKGFYIGSDPNEYYASLDGKISLQNDTIDIEEVHVIHGDVDLITERIEFYGDIEITGSVVAGVVIRAGRNVTINGCVSGAEIYAGGDIILKRGLQGGNRSRIIAKGDVYADFIEYAAVYAEKSVECNILLNSYVSANEYVKTQGARGSILGGYVHAGKGVIVNTVGNDAEIKTVIHAGFDKESYERMALLNKKRVEAEKLLKISNEKKDRLEQEICMKGLPAYRMEQANRELLEIDSQISTSSSMLKKIYAELEKLNKSLEESTDARIKVEGKIYRGVVISVDRGQLNMPTEDNHLAFYFDGNVVKSVPL